MNRLLLTCGEVDPSGCVVLADARARHVREVLHAVPGQELRIGLINGPPGTGRVEAVAMDTVTLICRFGTELPPVSPLDLLLAVPRPKVLRRLWAPLASVGVRRVVLVNAEKVERHYFDTHWLAEPVYRKELVDGLEQAGDTRLPEVHVRKRFKPFLEDELDGLFPDGVRRVAEPSPVPTAPDAWPQTGRCLLAVGPEGGWTPYELDMLHAHGFLQVSLGPRLLRVDTACVALLSVLRAHLR